MLYSPLLQEGITHWRTKFTSNTRHWEARNRSLREEKESMNRHLQVEKRGATQSLYSLIVLGKTRRLDEK